MGKTETSVAEAFSRAHAALLADLQELEQAVSPSSGEGMAELCARLNLVHTHLTEHFHFEEQNGYMDMVRKREPRLERAIQQLAEEHCQLAQCLSALIGEARRSENLDHRLRDQVREWVERVRSHEKRENELVQDAFNLDIGAED